MPAKQLPVHHLGAHAPLHRGIGPIGKLVSQTRPDAIAHHTKYRSGQQTHTRATMNQASFRREAGEDAGAYLQELPGRRWEPTVGGSGRARHSCLRGHGVGSRAFQSGSNLKL